MVNFFYSDAMSVMPQYVLLMVEENILKFLCRFSKGIGMVLNFVSINDAVK